jgi:hypothetical protein
VYLTADKYIIPGLKTLAKGKLESYLLEHWESEECISVIRIIYSPKRRGDPHLRDLVARLVVQNLSSLRDRQDFLSVLKDCPEFTYDFSLLMMERVFQLGRRWR